MRGNSDPVCPVTELSDADLLQMRSAVARELKRRGLAGNVGQVAEAHAIAFYNSTPGRPNLQAAPPGTQNVDALSNLVSVGDNVSSASNSSLSSLSGLSGLASIPGYLYIRNTGSLAELAGLESLATIGDYLHLESNDTLVSLGALHGLDSIGAGLTIIQNPILATAEAESLKDAIGIDNIGGDIDIHGNGGGR